MYRVVFIASLMINIFIIARHFLWHPDAKAVIKAQNKRSQARAEYLNSLKIDSGDIVFLGTSLTEEFLLSETFHSLKIKNRGCFGDKSKNILERLKIIIKQKPSAIFLECGVNDICNNIPLDTLKRNYLEILKIGGEKIFIQSIFPVGGVYEKFNDTITKFNTWLKDICSKCKLRYIEVPVTAANTFDGLHLSKSGYDIWKSKIQSYVSN